MLGTSIHARHERDFYPTPPECTQALINFLIPPGVRVKEGFSLWEPACGDDAMVDPLRASGNRVIATDVLPLASGTVFDYLTDEPTWQVDGIITNPPYGQLAQAFCEKSLEHIRSGRASFAALFMRHEYDCASGRRHLFGDCQEYYAKLTLTWRPRWIADSDGSPRHNYAWFLWSRKGNGQPRQFYAHVRK